MLDLFYLLGLLDRSFFLRICLLFGAASSEAPIPKRRKKKRNKGIEVRRRGEKAWIIEGVRWHAERYLDDTDRVAE